MVRIVNRRYYHRQEIDDHGRLRKFALIVCLLTFVHIVIVSYMMEYDFGSFSSIVSLERKNTTSDRIGYGVSLFGSIEYICGAVMLAFTLQNRNPNHDLVAVISGTLGTTKEQDQIGVEILQRAGYRIVRMEPLTIPTVKANQSHYQNFYSKLNAVSTQTARRKM